MKKTTDILPGLVFNTDRWYLYLNIATKYIRQKFVGRYKFVGQLQIV
ncbi:MAG: hypothetical protein AB8G86_05830 [Saprospiraceae bacterium]